METTIYVLYVQGPSRDWCIGMETQISDAVGRKPTAYGIGDGIRDLDYEFDTLEEAEAAKARVDALEIQRLVTRAYPYQRERRG